MKYFLIRFKSRGDKVGQPVWVGPRPTEKNVERVIYFNPLTRLGPPRIICNLCGAGRVDPHNSHNFKM